MRLYASIVVSVLLVACSRPTHMQVRADDMMLHGAKLPWKIRKAYTCNQVVPGMSTDLVFDLRGEPNEKIFEKEPVYFGSRVYFVKKETWIYNKGDTLISIDGVVR